MAPWKSMSRQGRWGDRAAGRRQVQLFLIVALLPQEVIVAQIKPGLLFRLLRLADGFQKLCRLNIPGPRRFGKLGELPGHIPGQAESLKVEGPVGPVLFRLRALHPAKFTSPRALDGELRLTIRLIATGGILIGRLQALGLNVVLPRQKVTLGHTLHDRLPGPAEGSGSHSLCVPSRLCDLVVFRRLGLLGVHHVLHVGGHILAGHLRGHRPGIGELGSAEGIGVLTHQPVGGVDVVLNRPRRIVQHGVPAGGEVADHVARLVYVLTRLGKTLATIGLIRLLAFFLTPDQKPLEVGVELLRDVLLGDGRSRLAALPAHVKSPS
ncbi:MAG: hypothetical protein QM805_07770 [Pseudomonas sp.]